MQTYADIHKRQQRMQRIAYATTDYNTAKNEFFNNKSVKSAEALIHIAGNLIKLQKMHDMSIQSNASVQARIDTAKVFLNTTNAKNEATAKAASEDFIKKVGKRNTQRLMKVK